MKTLKLLLLCLVIAATIPTFTGCVATQTREAAAFNTFRATYDTTHAAYQAFCAQVVSGRVSPEREAQADLAWNLFRASFRTAFVAASRNWSSPAPASLENQKQEVLKATKL